MQLTRSSKAEAKARELELSLWKERDEVHKVQASRDELRDQLEQTLEEKYSSMRVAIHIQKERELAENARKEVDLARGDYVRKREESNDKVISILREQQETKMSEAALTIKVQEFQKQLHEEQITVADTEVRSTQVQEKIIRKEYQFSNASREHEAALAGKDEKISETVAEIGQHKTEISVQQSEIMSISERVTELETDIEVLREERHELTTRFTERKSKLIQAEQQRKSSRQKVAELREQLGKVEYDKTTLQEQLDLSLQKEQSLRTELQSLAAEKSTLALLLQSAQEKEKSLQEQLEVGWKDQLGTERTLLRQLQESQELAAGLQIKSNSYLEELERLRPETEKARSELNEAEKQLTKIRQDLKWTQDTVSSRNDDIERIKNQLQECHQNHDNIRKQSADDRQNYELTKKDLAVAREKAAELGVKNQDLERDLKKAKSDCTDAMANGRVLKEKVTTAEFDTHRSNERSKALLTERDAAQTDLSHWRKVFLYGFQPPDVLNHILPLVSEAIDKSRNSGFDVGFIQDAVARWLKEISAPAQVPPMLYATPFACCLFTSALVLPESLGLATITTFGQLVVAARNVRPEVLPFLQAVV